MGMNNLIMNKEFQELLSKYPGDAVMMVGVEFNDHIALWELEVKGIKFTNHGEDVKAVLLVNDELSKEYETLLNGGEIDG